MRKKVEALKYEDLKQKLIDLIESETNGEIKIEESKEIETGEQFAMPVYIDLYEYSNEKLSEIIEENYSDIIDGILEEDYLSTIAMVFSNLKRREIKVNFKVSNRDSDDEECINLLIEY